MLGEEKNVVETARQKTSKDTNNGLKIGNVIDICRSIGYQATGQGSFAEYVFERTRKDISATLHKLSNNARSLSINLIQLGIPSLMAEYLRYVYSEDSFGRFELVLDELIELMNRDDRFENDRKNKMNNVCTGWKNAIVHSITEKTAHRQGFYDILDLFIQYSVTKPKNYKQEEPLEKCLKGTTKKSKNKEEKLIQEYSTYPDAPNAQESTDQFIFNFSNLLLNSSVLKSPIETVLPLAMPRRYHQPNEVEKLGNERKILDANICIPYKELYGSKNAEEAEFRYNNNISFTHNGFRSDYSETIPDFNVKMKEEEDISVAAGYGKENLEKLRLNSIEANHDPRTGNTGSIQIDFGIIDYFSHRIARNWLLRFEVDIICKEGRTSYLNVIKRQRANIDFSGSQWSMCGCGAWLVTSDNMILISYRTKVTEEVRKLGYSAAGSCDRHIYGANRERLYGADPFRIIAQETIKETGLSNTEITPSMFTLISLGLDLTRCLVQFSFFSRINKTAYEVLKIFENEAQSSHEQELFAVPFKSKPLEFLLRNFEMESGAVFSLLRCIEKGFVQ